MASMRSTLDKQACCHGRPAGLCRSVRAVAVRCQSSSGGRSTEQQLSRRQQLLASAAGLAGLALARPLPANAAIAPPEAPQKQFCDAACTEGLESKELVTTPSGLQYRDIVVGKGQEPPVGFQVVCHYVAMTPKYRIFDNSLERGQPYDIRVGAGQVVAGLDEGLSTMKPGGIRRLYIPGNLAFPKGLKAAAGRPSVPPSSPVIFDVQLLYIPGLEDDEE